MILILGIFVSCSSSKKFTSEKSKTEEIENSYTGRYQDKIPEKDSTKLEELVFNNPEILETETGIASYYGEDFHEKVTYSGVIYDMYGLSAAHPTYRMGTRIRVINLLNDRSIEIKINDRMPQWPDRIIDLSYGTAKELDMLSEGLVEVRIEVLQWGDGRE